jgi:integrase
MAWLIKQKRVPPKETRKRTYYRIGWREEGASSIQTRAIGFTTAAEAKAALKAFEARLALGLPPVPDEPTPSDDGSSPEATARSWTLTEYLDETFLPVFARDHAPKTVETTRGSASNLKRLLGDKSLADIRFAEVDQYITERKREGRRTRTIILELRCLKQCLQHAVDSEVLLGMPKLPRLRDTDRKAHKFLTVEQSIKVLEALRPFDEQPVVVTRGRPPIPRDRLTYLAVLMALNTGMRKGEILSRQWSDVRWDQGRNGTLLVCAKPEISFRVKKDRTRAIPLTPELREALEAAHAQVDTDDEDTWVFPSPRDASRPRKDFKQALYRACDRAGVPRVHPHALRHTWASRLAMEGVDRRSLMDIGGWKEGRMLDEIYAHVTDDHVDEVMSRMGLSPA